MRDLRPERWEGSELTVTLARSAAPRRRFIQEKTGELEAVLGEIAGRRVRIRLASPPAEESQPTTAAGADPWSGSQPVSREQKDRVMQLPLVRAVAEAFDATLVDVRTRPQRSPRQDDGQQ